MIILWLASCLLSTIFYVPYVNADKKAIFDALKLANLKSTENFLDLGSGRGEALIIASNNFGAKATGFEISPVPYFLSYLRTWRNKKCRVFRRDFRLATEEIKKADLIYMYLFDSYLAKIENIIFNNLKSNARVVTLAFQFPNKKAKKTAETTNLGLKTKIYLYQK